MTDVDEVMNAEELIDSHGLYATYHALLGCTDVAVELEHAREAYNWQDLESMALWVSKVVEKLGVSEVLQILRTSQ